MLNFAKTKMYILHYMDMPLYHHLRFYLTTIYLEDSESGNITAFFAQFPDAVAQGRTKEEAKDLLIEIFPVMMEDKQQEFVQEIYKTPGSKMTFENQMITA